MLTRRFAGVLGALSVAAPLAAQNVPVRTLAKPEVEFMEPFTALTAIRELRDGRVITIDPRDKIVQVVDLKAMTATKLGREGSGPGEYGLPFRLLALAADTSGVADILNNRILLVTPQATLGGFLDLNTPPPSGARGGRGTMMIGASMPTMADQKGRMYVQGPPITMVNDVPTPADSAPLIRWTRSSGRRDTVAWIRLPKSGAQVSGGRGNMSVRIGSGAPFDGADQVAVSPDGRVAIAHHEPYRVEFVSETGQKTLGQPIRYDKVRISDGHKAEWRESRKSAMGVAISMDNGRRSAAAVPMGNTPDPETWGGDFMPPFLANSLSFSTDGYLWIQRTGPVGMQPTWDVIDRAGALVMKVQLPKRTRLVGFGNGTVYTVRLDEDDLQYLQRHRFAMPERP